jgi:hypothetical protein
MSSVNFNREEALARLVVQDPSLFKRVKDVLAKKTLDYNGDKVASNPNFKLDDPRADYFPFDDYSYMHMVDTKNNRLKSILKARLMGNKSDPNFEGIEDSIVDIVAYCMFWYSAIENRKKLADLKTTTNFGITSSELRQVNG